MSVYIFALGIKAANGLVKSTINTANSFSNQGTEVSIINILGQKGGIEFLDPAFPLNEKVHRYSLDAISQKIVEGNEVNVLFHEENQQFLKAKYHFGHKKALQLINSTLTENDLIIFTHPLAMVLYVKANPQISAKTIIQVHGNYLEETDNLNLLSQYCNNVDYIQTVSQYMKKDLLEVLDVNPDKIHCIFNITHPIHLSKVEPQFTKRVSIIGSIQNRKNQLDAVKMLSHIPDRNVILQIYGKPLKQEYMQLIQSHIKLLGLTDRVIFKGLASEKEIYENTDVAIMTSEHEGFGYIFLECAVYDIPIVAYDFKYGAREFSNSNANNCLLPMGDHKGMAKTVETLLTNKDFYKKVTAINKERFQTTYSEQLILSDYNSLYTERANCKLIDDVIANYNTSSEITLKNITCTQKNLTKLPAWGTNEDDLIEELYYEISFYAENLPSDAQFSYVFKKSVFPIQTEVRYSKTSIKKRRFKPSFDAHDKKMEIVLTVPVENRLAVNGIMPNFDIIMESKLGGKRYICKVDKGSVSTSGMNFSDKYIEEHSGVSDISQVSSILRPDGFWIRYPRFEAIRSIKDENNVSLAYDTSIINVNGEEFLFFKIRDGLFNSLSVTMNSGINLHISFDKYTYKGVFEKLINIESKLDLFDIKIAGTYAWELVRANIFENILEAVGLFDKHFSKPSQIKNVYFGSKSMKALPEKSRLIFEFPRHSGVDFKTKAIQEQFVEDSVVLEYPQRLGYSDCAYDEHSNYFPIKDFLDYSKAHSSKIVFSSNDKKIIVWLGQQLKETFGLDVDLSLYFSKRISKFKCEFNYFDVFFKKNRFKEVLIPSAYWSAGIVAAARKNKIIASDIQYAIVSKYHPSFSFPVAGRAYGSDRAYIWSRYWNIKEAPYNKTIVTQSNYLEHRLKELGIDNLKMPKVEYDVCFTSQSRIGKSMFENALKYAVNNTSKKVVFCPHPDEDCSSYSGYIESLSLNNFSLNNQEDTLVIISRSDCVVGVYSTSIIEALALNKKTCCLAIDGFEVFEREINKGYIKLIKTVDELNGFIESESGSSDYMKLFYNL